VVGRWRRNRDEVIGGLVRLVGVARKVRNYLSDERFEAVVDEVAYEWGLGIEEFTNTITNIANIAERKQLTEEDIKKIINDKLESIEEALKNIEEELRRVRERVSGQLAGVEVFFINDFENGSAYPTVRLVNGELMVLGGYGYHEVVRAGSFGALASKVGRWLGAGSLVVLTGPKGVGKSTLAAVTIWELLMGGEVGMVLRIEELPGGEVVESFRSFIENFLVRDWEYFGNLIILYDPTGVYGQVGGVEAPSEFETTVRNVFEAVRRAIENAKSILGREPSARVGVLIILPTDLYNALNNDVKGKLESYRLNVSLNDAEFLAGLIREYTRTSDKPSGCKISDEELSKLASELAKFDSGYALIARLVGEELARSNCGVGKVEELIDNAKGKAEAFITQYINKLFKVNENPDTAKALIEIFALRRPFIGEVESGYPILTPGIVELIGEARGAKILYGAEGKELRSWLAIRQHDLIEDSIEELLRCIVNESKECKEKLGTTLEPWRLRTVRKSLREISEKVLDEYDAVEYFVHNYGKDFTNTLRDFSNKCWKRAALIIGCALAGHDSLPRFDIPLPIVIRPGSPPKSLREDIAESLGDALGGCGVDDYLLVGDKIPTLIMNLVLNNTRALTEAFIDKYNEAINEVGRVRDTARGRSIYGVEGVYGLGLASIIAKAAELGKPIKPSDVDAALRIVFAAFISPDYVKPVLRVLEPLRNKAPHRYLELQVSSLVDAMDNYISQLSRYGREDVVNKIFDLLNELGRLSPNLGFIAWARVLAQALENEDVRLLIERRLGINVVDKADEVLEELSKLKEKVRELMMDEAFVSYVESKELMKDEGVMGYVEFKPVKAVEGAVKRTILKETFPLKHKLAHYKFRNDDLDDAARLFNEMAEEDREIGIYENYLANSNWALRAEAINGSLVGDELVKKFQQLYEEAFNEKHFENTAWYLSTASLILGGYLVSLALMGDHETINKLLEKHLWVLNAVREVSVLTRLLLNALLSSRGRLSSELKGKLSVNPEELIDAFRYDMRRKYLPALKVAFGMIRPEDGYEECKSIRNSTERRDCKGAVLAVMDDSDAVGWLRGELINDFHKQILENERSGWLRELGFDTNALISEFGKLVYGLDGKSLAQLLAINSSMAQLALILHALINGNKELAKALALYGAIYSSSKLLGRLFLKVYKECCDLGKDEFRHALARLFFYHI
jgi:KaiC/GvpD/RAD55 family RecA-like ATPase/archaellum component FlaC